MRAVVVYPSLPRPPELTDVPVPRPEPGQVRIKTLQVGVCGTDREILAGGHGRPPPGLDRLVLGHESFGVIEETGEYVVATVRRGCDACGHCNDGMSDFCDTGNFVERGILGMDGFLAERYVEDPRYLVKVPASLKDVGVLLEPLSVVEKALQQAIGAQARIPGKPLGDPEPWRDTPPTWRANRALVLGAGPIGMLAALALRLAGSEEVVLVERTPRRKKEGIATESGATYVATEGKPLRDVLADRRFDVILEAAGSAQAVVDAMPLLAPNGVVCLTGIFAAGHPPRAVALNDLFREMVYRNQAIVTSVNSNRAYFERGVETMGRLEQRWPGLLQRLITRRVPMERYAEAVEPEADGVKTVVEVAPAA